MRAVHVVVVCAAGAAALAPISPEIVERWYSRGLYATLQPPITGLSSLVPFALLDVALAVTAILIAVALMRTWRKFSFLMWAREVTVAAAVVAAALYLWFLLFWGFNYRRVPLEQKLAYDQSRVTREEALDLARVAVEQVNTLVADAREQPDEYRALAAVFATVQRTLGDPKPARVAQPKLSLLTWYFRKAAIDGMTDPFFLEIIVTPDLLAFERPHTLAHEWAHLAGYADESEANFVAWLTCVRSTSFARYSGWLSAYQHLSRVLPREDRKVLRSSLSDAVVADLDRIALRLARASPAISTAARGAYDTYLRANRIEEGIANYGVVVRLMLGTSFGAEWTPRLRE